MNIAGPTDMTMDEIDAASNFIKEEVNKDAEIIWGVVLDDAMEDEIQITVIATGINDNGNGSRRRSVYVEEYPNVVNIRDADPEDTEADWTVKMNGVCLDTPTFQRKGEGLAASMDNNGAREGKKGFFQQISCKG